MINKEKTGGVRMRSMLCKVTKPYLWIDTYNQCVNDIAGTIKARIDSNCMYFVSVPDERNIRTIKDEG